jgi:hypothetical protein
MVDGGIYVASHWLFTLQNLQSLDVAVCAGEK